MLCSLALSKEDKSRLLEKQGPQGQGEPRSPLVSMVSRAAPGLYGEGDGSIDPEAGAAGTPPEPAQAVKAPGMQPAGKGSPPTPSCSRPFCAGRAGSPKPRWGPDGFSLKTFPENLGDPGQHGLGHSSRPVSGEQAVPWLPCGVLSKSLLPWACVPPS